MSDGYITTAKEEQDNVRRQQKELSPEFAELERRVRLEFEEKGENLRKRFEGVRAEIKRHFDEGSSGAVLEDARGISELLQTREFFRTFEAEKNNRQRIRTAIKQFEDKSFKAWDQYRRFSELEQRK